MSQEFNFVNYSKFAGLDTDLDLVLHQHWRGCHPLLEHMNMFLFLKNVFYLFINPSELIPFYQVFKFLGLFLYRFSSAFVGYLLTSLKRASSMELFFFFQVLREEETLSNETVEFSSCEAWIDIVALFLL